MPSIFCRIRISSFNRRLYNSAAISLSQKETVEEQSVGRAGFSTQDFAIGKSFGDLEDCCRLSTPSNSSDPRIPTLPHGFDDKVLLWTRRRQRKDIGRDRREPTRPTPPDSRMHNPPRPSFAHCVQQRPSSVITQHPLLSRLYSPEHHVQTSRTIFSPPGVVALKMPFALESLANHSARPHHQPAKTTRLRSSPLDPRPGHRPTTVTTPPHRPIPSPADPPRSPNLCKPPPSNVFKAPAVPPSRCR
jgi:hypothetical protein